LLLQNQFNEELLQPLVAVVDAELNERKQNNSFQPSIVQTEEKIVNEQVLFLLSCSNPHSAKAIEQLTHLGSILSTKILTSEKFSKKSENFKTH
jgi:hypothetical protein